MESLLKRDGEWIPRRRDIVGALLREPGLTTHGVAALVYGNGRHGWGRVRPFLEILENRGFVTSGAPPKKGRGRPGKAYFLTDRGRLEAYRAGLPPVDSFEDALVSLERRGVLRPPETHRIMDLVSRQVIRETLEEIEFNFLNMLVTDGGAPGRRRRPREELMALRRSLLPREEGASAQARLLIGSWLFRLEYGEKLYLTRIMRRMKRPIAAEDVRLLFPSVDAVNRRRLTRDFISLSDALSRPAEEGDLLLWLSKKLLMARFRERTERLYRSLGVSNIADLREAQMEDDMFADFSLFP